MKLILVLAAALCSSSPAADPLTLDQAVARSIENYPAVRVSLEQVSAAAAGVQLARTGFLPKADFLAQVNRATRNNVFGMLMPQATLPSISGPPLHENKMTNVWGTAVGFLVSWEPFDFGLRQANVAAADTVRRRAQAGVARTRLEVGTAAADAFLTILAAEQTVRGAEAAIARGRTVEGVVSALVKSELRPGADAERIKAEIALAETQRIQAEQAVAVARAALAQLLNTPPGEVRALAGRLLDAPPDAEPAAAPLDEHPAAREQSVAIDEAKARLAVLDKAYYPKFLLQGANYARGTGAYPDFRTGGAASGLGPNIVNWGAGFTMQFPLMDLPSIRARKEMEIHKERGEQARHEQLLRDINGRFEKSKAMLDGARRVARQTPVQLNAARTLETQAAARYKAGLATIVEVAEAQRLLAQADVDDSLAKLNVWRSLLAVAAAQGNLDDLLAKVR